MKRILCPQLPKPNRPTVLPEAEANHAVRVLRLRDGDSIEAIDGQGHAVTAILRVQGGAVRLELPASATSAVLSTRTEATGAIVPLTLEMAILKGDAMEWVVEKAVELGVRTLIPTLTTHIVVQTKQKGPEVFQERWQKIADQALKQCGRLERMHVELPTPLEKLLVTSPSSAGQPRIWCDELTRGEPERNLLNVLGQPWKEARLLIGPEGGWSEEERSLLKASSAEKVSLGPLVLRAETAAICGMSLIGASYRASNLLTKTHG